MTAKRAPNKIVEGLSVPELWGNENEYGINYPPGYEQSQQPRVDIDLPSGGGYSGDPALAGQAFDMLKKPTPKSSIAEATGQQIGPEQKPNRKILKDILIKSLPSQKNPLSRDAFRETKTLYDQRVKGLWKHSFPGVAWGSELTPEQKQGWHKNSQWLWQQSEEEVKSNIGMELGAYKEGLGDIEKQLKQTNPITDTFTNDKGERVRVTLDPQGNVVAKTIIGKASSAGLEERMNKRQELISIRQDKRNLKREIDKVRGLPNLDLYKTQKGRLPSLEDELKELEGREKELLGKGEEKGKAKGPKKGKTDPLGIR